MKSKGPFLSAMLKWPIPVFFLALVAFLLAAFGLYGLVGSNHWPEHWKADGDISGLADMLLSPATSLAGALVAIVLAVHAVQLQERDQRRETLQAQVEMLRLISEQTAPFMTAYARCILRIRKFFSVLEIHGDVLYTPVSNPPTLQEIQSLGNDSIPVVRAMNKELTLLAELLDDLHMAGNSDAFSTSIYETLFGSHQLSFSVDQSVKAVPLNALPTIALIINVHVARLEALLGRSTAPNELGLLLIQARMMANESRNSDGQKFNHHLLRLALLHGHLYDNTVTLQMLNSGDEIRPPLMELLCKLMSVVDAQGVSRCMNELFKGNEVLQPVLERIGGFMPDPLDPTLREMLHAYSTERPRFKMVNGQFK